MEREKSVESQLTPSSTSGAVRQSMRTAFDEAGQKALRDTLRDLAKERRVRFSFAVPPEAWWFHFLQSYLNFFTNSFSRAEDLATSAVEVLVPGVSRNLIRERKRRLNFRRIETKFLRGTNFAE
jgi:hypothetical protein